MKQKEFTMQSMSNAQVITIALILLGPVLGYAASKTVKPTFYLDNKPVEKVEAIKALLDNPSAPVTKCQPVELSPTLTLVNRKQ